MRTTGITVEPNDSNEKSEPGLEAEQTTSFLPQESSTKGKPGSKAQANQSHGPSTTAKQKPSSQPASTRNDHTLPTDESSIASNKDSSGPHGRSHRIETEASGSDDIRGRPKAAPAQTIDTIDEVESVRDLRKRRHSTDDAAADASDRLKTKRARTRSDESSESQDADADPYATPKGAPEWAQSPGSRFGPGSGHLQKFIDTDVDRLVRELEQLQDTVLGATMATLNGIGEFATCMCPLDRHPSNELLRLYEKCWGPEWQAVRLKLTRDHLFTPSQVMMSLISAFLHTKLLDRKALRREIQDIVLNITGLHGHVLQAVTSDKGWEDNLDHVIDIVNAKNALDLLEGDDNTFQDTLRTVALGLATEFWEIITAPRLTYSCPRPRARETRPKRRGMVLNHRD